MIGMSISGFKGIETALKLGNLNLVTGPNGSGKTGRMLALAWAITGYTPLGKTPAATAALCSGRRMSVAVRMDQFGWTRGLDKDPVTGRVAAELMIHGQEGQKLADAESMLGQHVGTFTAALNLDEFRVLSPDLRRQFILSLCEQAKQDMGGDIMSRLSLAMADQILGGGQADAVIKSTFKTTRDQLDGEELPNAAKALWQLVGDDKQAAWKKLAKRFAQDVVSDDVLQTITAWVARAKDLKAEYRRSRDNAQAAVQKLTEEKNRKTASAEHIETLRDRAAELQKKLDELNGAIGAAKASVNGVRAAQSALAAADIRVQSATAEFSRLHAKLATNPNWMHQVEDLERQAGASDQSAPISVIQEATNASEKVRGKEAELRTLHQDVIAATQACERGQRNITELEKELEHARDNVWQTCLNLIDRVVENLDEDHPAWEPAEMLADVIREGAGDPEKKVAEIQERIAYFTDQIERSQTMGAEAMQKIDHAEDELADYKSLEATANAKASEARSSAANAVALMRKARAISDEYSGCPFSIERAQKLVDEAVAAQTAAKQMADGVPGASSSEVELGELEHTRNQTTFSLAAARDAIASKERVEALGIELASCISSAQSDAVCYDLADASEKAVKSLRELLLMDQVRPLIQAIDTFLVGTGRDGRSYCRLENDKGKPIFDLGWIVTDESGAERSISMDAMSGGEAGLFYTGLAYALLIMSENPLKVLTIEGDSLDSTNMIRLINGLQSVANDIDCVLLSTCHYHNLALDEGMWSIHSCGE